MIVNAFEQEDGQGANGAAFIDRSVQIMCKRQILQ